MKKERLSSIILIFFVVLNLVWVPAFYKNHIGKYSYFFDDTTLSVAGRIKDLTNSKDPIFILGSQPVLYPLSDRLPAGRVFTANLPWNMLVSEPTILNGLVTHKPALVIRDTSATIDNIRVVDFTGKINQFIDKNYYKVDEIGTNEIYLLKINNNENSN